VRYIWLNGIDGRAVAVNPSRVIWVREAHNSSGKTYLAFGKDMGLTVEEDLAKVVELLDSAAE
jgi:hypothetical protein